MNKTDCVHYVNPRKCNLLTVMDCRNCPFYQPKKSDDLEEQLRLYKIRKRRQDAEAKETKTT